MVGHVADVAVEIGFNICVAVVADVVVVGQIDTVAR